MASYDLIQTDPDLADLVALLRRRDRLAVDLEGENNLHAYGIRVCLIQLFDGEKGYIVDPLAIRTKDLLRELFEASDWLKVMFDSTNDLLALQHDLGIRPSSLYDLAIAAQLLHRPGGLHVLRDGPHSARSKDRFQKSNWLRRPVAKEMLDYAISDVVDLLALADTLSADLAEEGLTAEFDRRNRERLGKVRVWDPLGNFTRIPGFQRMRRAASDRAKALWYAREYYARLHDLAPENVASKPRLATIVELGVRDGEAIARLLNEDRQRNRIDPRDFARTLADAERDAEADTRQGG